MKRLFDRLKRSGASAHTASSTAEDTGYFSSMFHELPGDVQTRASWRARAAEVSAKPLDARRGHELFAQLWRADKHMLQLSDDELKRMGQHFEFVTIPAGREVIGQDELGNYMMVLLEGSISVDRVQAWGARARLAEAHAGDMLGEMSLLDAGARFSSCVTLSPCSIAIIDATTLDELMAQEPKLGLALLATLSRRLSLRLRQVSARLSALLAQS